MKWGLAYSAGAIIAAIVLLTWLFRVEDKCPRSIMGYNCRGQNCDHSDKALADAKRARR